jgi:hypothetical protein
VSIAIQIVFYATQIIIGKLDQTAALKIVGPDIMEKAIQDFALSALQDVRFVLNLVQLSLALHANQLLEFNIISAQIVVFKFVPLENMEDLTQILCNLVTDAIPLVQLAMEAVAQTA